MTRGLNLVQLIGNLGDAPLCRLLPDGTPFATFRVATNVTSDGIADWHHIVCRGRLAERVGIALKKGALVYVQGQSRRRYWQDKDGAERSSYEVHADDVLILMRLVEIDQGASGSR